MVQPIFCKSKTEGGEHVIKKKNETNKQNKTKILHFSIIASLPVIRPTNFAWMNLQIFLSIEWIKYLEKFLWNIFLPLGLLLHILIIKKGTFLYYLCYEFTWIFFGRILCLNSAPLINFKILVLDPLPININTLSPSPFFLSLIGDWGRKKAILYILSHVFCIKFDFEVK